jgi:hypothetical protein
MLSIKKSAPETLLLKYCLSNQFAENKGQQPKLNLVHAFRDMVPEFANLSDIAIAKTLNMCSVVRMTAQNPEWRIYDPQRVGMFLPLRGDFEVVFSA